MCVSPEILPSKDKDLSDMGNKLWNTSFSVYIFAPVTDILGILMHNGNTGYCPFFFS